MSSDLKLTDAEKKMMRFLAIASGVLRNGKMTPKDGVILSSVLHAAETGTNPNMRVHTYQIVSDIITGDPRKNFDDARHDLVDGTFFKRVAQGAANDPEPAVRYYAARTLYAASGIIGRPDIDDEVFAAPFRLAATERAVKPLEIDYYARNEMMGRFPERLTPILLETLAQPIPTGATDQMHRIAFGARSFILMKREDIVTPAFMEQFHKDSENSPVSEIPGAFFCLMFSYSCKRKDQKEAAGELAAGDRGDAETAFSKRPSLMSVLGRFVHSFGRHPKP